MRYRIDVLLLAFLAFAPLQAGAQDATAQDPSAPCANCGTVTGIEKTTVQEQWTALGTVTPGAVSAQSAGSEEMRSAFAFNKQGGREMVFLGAAGGAVYSKRPNAYQKPRWDVSVKMDTGGTRVIQQTYEPLLKEGDRVRIYGTQIELI
jgi:hypothetical protein